MKGLGGLMGDEKGGSEDKKCSKKNKNRYPKGGKYVAEPEKPRE